MIKSCGVDFYGSGTIGERGQIVVPSEAREKLNIKAGDKFVFFGHGPILHLVRSDEMDKMFSHIHKKFEEKVKEIKNKINEGE